jgi:LysR family transcriptional regulator, glycine cleavage system transcriptional activator
MQNLPLGALRAFAAVYEHGGVRPASRELHVTHSSVSRHLRELENWLGIALIEQRDGPRRMKFTPQGEALGRAALKSFGELASAVAGLRESRRGNSVAIATTPSIAVRWLLPRLTIFQAAHPRIEVSVIAEQVALDLSQQRADIGLRMGAGAWPNLICEPLMDDALYPVAKRAYLSSIGSPRSTRGLAKARLIHDRDPAGAWEKWFAAHPAPGVNTRAGPRFTSSDLTLRAAAQGLGVALARDRLAAEDVASGVLVRPFGDLSVVISNAYWIVRPPDHDIRPEEIALTDWLKSEAAKPSTHLRLNN